MKPTLAIVTMLLASTITLVALASAQPRAGTPKDAPDDRTLVETAVLNYINSYYQTRPELLEQSVHPNLKKRNIRSIEGGGEYLNEMSRSQLIAIAKVANADGRWNESSRKDIAILDIDGNIASAKLTAENWIDYFHLARINGDWMIVNVLWEGR